MSDWHNFQKKVRTPRNWWKTGIYLKIGAWRIFFLKLCQSLNFYQISKRMAPNCSEEQSPYRKISKKIPSPHIRGGEPVNFHINNFLGVSWKLWGSHPPLYIYIYFFNIFSIRGLLFWTIWSLPFWNLIKIERLTQFPKKSPNPPEMVENWNISENRGGESFFGNCVNRSIFLRFQNEWH